MSGEDSHQMLARFETDVLSMHPATVHILAGTNDVYHISIGMMPRDSGLSAVQEMADRATAAGAKVIIGLIPPKTDDQTTEYEGLTGAAAIYAWNLELTLLARAYGYQLADYHHQLIDPDGVEDPAYFEAHGTHPNVEGEVHMWAALKPLVEP